MSSDRGAMLGRSAARAKSGAGRWIGRAFGRRDIHERQKWAALWPRLAALPASPLRVLDAGCGAGDWAIELGALRPEWTVVGLDMDAGAIGEAERKRRALGLSSVSFQHADFLAYRAPMAFDVVLSVASAHYLAELGRGGELFVRFRSWLTPGGTLLLLAPRASAEAGFFAGLPRAAWRTVFTEPGLRELCRSSGFEVRGLEPCLGGWAALAKQLAWGAQRHGVVSAMVYPALLMLTAVDSRRVPHAGSRSIMWLLEASADG